MCLLNIAVDGDHDLLSLDPAMVVVKAADPIAGWPASDRLHVRAFAHGAAMHEHTVGLSRLGYRLELQGGPDGTELV
jgi:hypothetical protein